MATNPRSWRNKLLTPTQESPITSTETSLPKSEIHGRVLFILGQLASGDVAKLGIPGEEQLRALLLKKARNQVDNISEQDLGRYVAMLQSVCQGVINGGEDWEKVIVNSDSESSDVADATETAELNTA